MASSQLLPTSTIVGNEKPEYRKRSTTTDHYTLQGDQQIFTTNTINSPSPSPPPIQSIVPKIAPRPLGIPRNARNSIATMIKSEPIEDETFDGAHNSIGLNTASTISYTTSTSLPGIDGDMATTLLRTTSAKAMGTNATGMVPMGVSQFGRSSTAAIPHFDFLQAHEEMTQADLSGLPSTLEHNGQQSPHTAMHEASTTVIQVENLCDMTVAQLQQQQQPLLVAEMLRKELNHQKVKWAYYICLTTD